MTIAFLLRYVLPVVVVAGLVWWGVAEFDARDARLIEQGRQEVRAADIKEAQRVKAEADVVAGKFERDALINQERRDASFRDVARVAVHLPAAIRSVPVPGVVVGLLNLAVDQSNGAAGPAAEPHATAAPAAEVADSTQGDLADWAVEVIRVCTMYRDRAQAWAAWYGNLQHIYQGETP